MDSGGKGLLRTGSCPSAAGDSAARGLRFSLPLPPRHHCFPLLLPLSSTSATAARISTCTARKQPHRLRIADERETAEGQVRTISAVWSMWRCSHVASACLHSSTDASSVFCSVRSCSFPASSP